MKIRIKFRKYGAMKFIGHLDIMRFFQKVIRRAGIDIAYTEGFSPHMVMSFASPLGVGLISDGEYFDITVHSTASTEESLRALNAETAEGIEITDYRLLPDGSGKAMAMVAAAEYDLWYRHPDLENPEHFSPEEIAAGIGPYYRDRAEILITKKTKKSEREVDVRPHILEFSLFQGKDEAGSDTYGFHLFLSAGSQENIRPELIAEDFSRFFGKPFDPLAWQIRRNDVYARTDEGFAPLCEFGERIG